MCHLSHLLLFKLSNVRNQLHSSSLTMKDLHDIASYYNDSDAEKEDRWLKRLLDHVKMLIISVETLVYPRQPLFCPTQAVSNI